MTENTLLNLAEISGVGRGFATTPDGRIVHSEDIDGNNELFLGGDQLTDAGVDFLSPTWLTERESIVVLTSVRGDSQHNVVEVDPATGAVDTVLEADYLTQDLRASPAEHSTVGLLAGKGGGMDIYALDLDTGEMQQIASPDQFAVAYDWAPDGDAVVYQEGMQMHTSIHVSQLDGAEYALADEADSEQFFRNEGFNASAYWNDSGVLLATNADSDTADIAVSHPETGDTEVVVESANQKIPLGWRPDGDAFAYVEYLGGDYLLKMWENGDVSPVTDEGHTNEARWLNDGSIVHRTSTYNTPFGIYVGGDRVAGPAVDESLVAPEVVSFEAHDGHELMGLLYEPDNADDALVYAIGGPGQTVTSDFHSRTQALASEGLTVLWVSYRGCGGLGRDHLLANGGDLGGDDAHDLAVGAGFLRDHGYDTVGVYGHSYGGYLGIMSEVRSGAFDTCINHAGPTDLLALFQRTRGFSAKGIMQKMGGSPDEIPEKYRERSPVTHTDDIDASVLLVGASNDRHVPPEGIEAFEEALAENGVTNKMVIYEDGHSLHDPQNRVDLAEQMYEFCRDVEGR